jgi:hypothetical protein
VGQNESIEVGLRSKTMVSEDEEGREKVEEREEYDGVL